MVRYSPEERSRTMAKADLLRVADVRRAYRLIGECRDLGGDPTSWQPRMMEGLSQLFRDAPATGGEGRLVGTNGAIVPTTYFDHGFDAADRRTYLGYIREGGAMVDPFVHALHRTPGSPVTRTRKQVVSDAVYRRAPVFDRYFRPGNVHHRLASILATSDRTVCLLHLHRHRGERDFSSRDRALLEFFHGELGPLIGRALVSAAEASPVRLPRRLRQTLACLVEGDTEKQVATHLGVSHATAHQYVTALYRRFGVNSRGQLLAHVM
jgi:DNA-binding CsgD family transcriptional regulator